MLKDYYERLCERLEEKISAGLEADDTSKFSASAIKKDLEVLQDCRNKVEELSKDPQEDWDKLSKETKDKILRLIEEDLNGDHAR